MPQSGPGANARPSCHEPVVPAPTRDDQSHGQAERTPVRFYKPRRAGASRGTWGVRLLVPVLCVLAGMLGVVAPAFAGLTHVNESSFGEEGSGAGQLNRPTGVAVNDATGDVYVLDAGNERVEQFTAAGSFVREFEPPGGFEPFTAPGTIAVDDSANPLDVSKEDVYVSDPAAETIDKFEADGHFLGAIHEAETGKTLSGLVGVAIDDEGHVWASYGCNELSEFSDTQPNGFVVTQEATTGSCLGAGLGVDSEGDLWAIQGSGFGAKLSPTGEVLNPPGQEVGGEGHHGLAVDATTNSVYLASASDVVEYTASGSEIEAFGAGHLSGVEAESEPVAIDPATGTVYAADVSADAIRVFPYVILPVVMSATATGLGQEGDATLNATVNPEGAPITECKFEYGTSTSYGETVPCTQTPAQIGSGTNPVPVSANLTGLTVPSQYHYRLAASNTSIEAVGEDETFTAGAKPEIRYPAVLSPASSEESITAYVVPGGLATTYRVDYGLTEAYGSSTGEISAGSGMSSNLIRVAVHGLSPSTSYDARIVAQNTLGVSEVKLESFTTPATPEPDAGLPDQRAYELVSPASEPGEVDVPTVEEVGLTQSSESAARAAASGDAVIYPADTAATGGSGSQANGGDQFIARRGTGGWTASDISPNLPQSSPVASFEAFSSELSSAVYNEYEGRSPQAGVSAPAGCSQAIYRYGVEAAAFAPLFSSTLTPGQCGEPLFVGASEAWGEVFFQDEAPLVAGTHASAHSVAQRTGGCVEGCNLYDASAGGLSVVNVLPDGSTTEGAIFGGVAPPINGHAWTALAGVVAGDGSRAFWTDTEPGPDEGRIFVRLNPDQEQSAISGGGCTEPGKACTLPVSVGAAKYLAATPSGRFVFYLEAGGLWRYDTLTDERAAIAGGSASVAGLVGASSDGEWVYFVADAALTSTPSASGEVAQPRICEGYEAQIRALREQREKGEITEQEFQELRTNVGAEEADDRYGTALPAHTGCNLYLWHAGAFTFVGDLSPRDNEVDRASQFAGMEGPWQPNVASHTAHVSPDGQHVAFASFRSLAGANNLARDPESNPIARDSFSEIYMFDAGPASRLVCVSCRPNGASPNWGTSSTKTFVPANFSDVFAPRWVSEDGSQVFFDSDQPLVADEPSGNQGVYEWEREGSGTCGVVTPSRRDGGCISLLSGTGATADSYFVEADPSGENVFIESRNQLTTQGNGERMMLYDVRAGGGFAEGSQACTGTGCQGVPPAGPSFATPPSETFGGTGNFGPQPVVKPATKPLSPARRLAGALRACRRNHKRRARERCERKAHEAYPRAIHVSAKKSTKKGHRHA